MNCSQARNILFPSPEKALATIETPAALGHLRGCESCQTFFEQQQKWSSALQAKAGAESAPEALRERIGRLIERHRTANSERLNTRRHFLAGAAAIVLAAGLGLLWPAWKLPSRAFFQEMCLDHVKYLDAQLQFSSANPAAIELWFRDKTEFRVHVPTLTDADLIGSRLCFLKQHKAALIFYRKQGQAVSLFEFSQSGVSLSALDRTVLDGSPIWHKSFNGYSLVAFESRGVVTVLVSDLPEGELVPLALAARRS